MPSLLSRFLGKKKNANPTPLLDGEKYEAVPKTPSPSAPTFSDTAQRPKSPSKARSKEHPDKGLGIHIRRKHAPTVPAEPKVKETVPILSLSLPDTRLEEKKLQGLGVVFEGITDGPPRLDDEALGEKRLTPAETLRLVQKTSDAISERGLKTLGVMRPHWFASPRQQETQLKLISRFLQTLSAQQANGNASASASSPSTFESELRYTRDPHDVAAVLRWGLRHLQLEGNIFGSSGTADWYGSFVDSERSGSYQSKAFDDALVPLLPASHTQLLRATLDLVSSLAAHSEENGISGNKLSKVLGWWIISSRDVRGAGWSEFYTQWEAAARQFEHLFLAYIRAQEAQSRMPKRLTELVRNYPFARNRREEDGIFLPRSRFSTRSANALLVRVAADKSSASSRPHPLRIVEDAFKASAESEFTGEYATLWHDIRKIATKPIPSGDETKEKSETDEPENLLNLSTILADETIRLLSLVPTSDGTIVRARRSLSVGDRSPSASVANGNTHGLAKDAPANGKVPASPSTTTRELDIVTDWQAFSNAGFRSPSGLSLAASLWDNETEVTQPAPKKGGGLSKRNISVKSGTARRASVDSPTATQIAHTSQLGRLTYGDPRLVKLDEAFIDFWADTLLDAIARTWPTFVVCQLKSIPALRLTENEKPIEWLVIERVVAEPARPPPPSPEKPVVTSARAGSPVPNSPTKSEGAKSPKWTTSTIAATRKRWSLFSPKHDSAPAVQGGKDRAARRAATSAKVGEMGELLQEEDNGKSDGVKANGATKETSVSKKEEKKKQDVTPAVHTNDVSRPAETPVPAREEAAVLDKTEPAVEVAPARGLAAVMEEPAAEPKPTTEPVDTQAEAVASQVPAVTEAAAESQSVGEPVHPQGQTALASEPTTAPEPHRSAPSAPLEEPQVSQDDNPTHTDVIPAVEEAQAPVPAPAVDSQVAPASIVVESEPIESSPLEQFTNDDASKSGTEEILGPHVENNSVAISDIPAEPEVPIEHTSTPLEGVQEPTLPTHLEDAPVGQPPADHPDVSQPPVEPEVPPPLEEGPPASADELISTPIDEPHTSESSAEKPEATRAPTPVKALEEPVDASRPLEVLTLPPVAESSVEGAAETGLPAGPEPQPEPQPDPVEEPAITLTSVEDVRVASEEPAVPAVGPAAEHTEESVASPSISNDEVQADGFPTHPEDTEPSAVVEDEPEPQSENPAHAEEPPVSNNETSVDAAITAKNDVDLPEIPTTPHTEETPAEAAP